MKLYRLTNVKFAVDVIYFRVNLELITYYLKKNKPIYVWADSVYYLTQQRINRGEVKCEVYSLGFDIENSTE
jgi:hypothetical protein